MRQVLAVGIGRDERRRAALSVVAPGTPLRDGLERIVHGNTGALIVLGFDPIVGEICSGGFELNVGFAATRLRELAKMDGAIVLDQACTQILRAAVQLIPDPGLPTSESGTRHRTAERVSRQTGYPVIAVSKSMRTVAVFTAGERYVLEDSAALLTRAHQALATLERYKHRLDDAAAALTALEIEDRAAIADIARLAQRLEMASRVTEEIAGCLVELGTDAGSIGLQLEELTAGTSRERELLLRDYRPAATAVCGATPDEPAHAADRALSGLSADDLVDLPSVAAAIGLGPAAGMDEHVSPLGHRVLGQIPRLPQAAADGLVAEFGSLQKLLSASAQDLRRVPAIDAGLASRVREGLSRIAESALLERYQ